MIKKIIINKKLSTLFKPKLILEVINKTNIITIKEINIIHTIEIIIINTITIIIEEVIIIIINLNMDKYIVLILIVGLMIAICKYLMI